MSLYALQKELLVQFATITRNTPMSMDTETASNISRLLHEYCDALRDRQYMTERSKSGLYANPFVLQSRKFMDNTLIDDLKKEFNVPPHDLASCLRADKRLDNILPGGPWDPEAQVKNQREENAKERKAQIERYFMALIGSLILIGPMILMVLVEGIIVRLSTAGVCTAVFAFAFARLSTNSSSVELMTVTAAYTAILVVFVGTSTGS